MPQRLAAAMSLLAFAACLIVGLAADNPFVTTVERALSGMIGTFVVGLIIGVMAQKMIEENVKNQEKKQADLQAKNAGGDR